MGMCDKMEILTSQEDSLISGSRPLSNLSPSTPPETLLSPSVVNTYHLQPFEEATGRLSELLDDQGILHAKVGRIVITLPIDMKEVLKPCLGKRLSILRTDNPLKPYLWRILPDENNQGTVDEEHSD